MDPVHCLLDTEVLTVTDGKQGTIFSAIGVVMSGKSGEVKFQRAPAAAKFC